MRKAHGKDGIPGLEKREKDGKVCVRTAMGLDVCVLRAEESAGTLPCKVFDLVDVLASAVVPFPGVALCVLIGEDCSRGEQDGFRDDILRSDQLDILLLAVQFALAGVVNLGVVLFEFFKKHLVLLSL